MENNSLVNPMPRIGDKAPEFQANTTMGTINFPQDYRGKWVIFFSHPADFTPVCTSEFMTFGVLAEEFRSLNCELVGLSVDGVYSHIAWLRTIRDNIEFNGMKNVEITFPLIDDVSMDVSRKYGMIQPNESKTAAVRAVFFIDPEGVIRTIIYYPMCLGRNFDEIKRVLIALQTSDEFEVSMPADWKPGDEVIVPNSGVCEFGDKSCKDEQIKYYDWFFRTRKISKEEIEKKIYKKK